MRLMKNLRELKFDLLPEEQLRRAYLDDYEDEEVRKALWSAVTVFQDQKTKKQYVVKKTGEDGYSRNNKGKLTVNKDAFYDGDRGNDGKVMDNKSTDGGGSGGVAVSKEPASDGSVVAKNGKTATKTGGTDDTETDTENGETGAGQVKVDIPPELENKKYEQHTEEEREVLRNQDHAIADDQLTYDKSTMKVEIAKAKDAENCSSPNEKAAETISRKILEKKYGEPPVDENGEPVTLTLGVGIPTEEQVRRANGKFNAGVGGHQKSKDTWNGEVRDGEYYPTIKELKDAVGDYREEHGMATEGVGAGTPDSRAGEVITHYSLRRLQELDPKTPEEFKESRKIIEGELKQIQEDAGKTSVLSDSWIDAGLNATEKIIEEIGGAKNIQEIAWDTPAGRGLLGVDGHDTSSDMFLRTKDGKTFGISLKKDGNVFVANKGLDKEQKKMEENLREDGMKLVEDGEINPETKKAYTKKDVESSVKAFNEQTSLETFNTNLKTNTKKAVSKANNNPEAVKNLVKLLHVQTDQDRFALSKLMNQSEDEEGWASAKKKYLDRIDQKGPPYSEKKIKEWLKKHAGEGGLKTKEDQKTFLKLAKLMDDKSYYLEGKKTDANHTDAILEAADHDLNPATAPLVENALKNMVVRGLHAETILGTDENPVLDGFFVGYGIPPSGSTMNKDTITELFPDIKGPPDLIENRLKEEFEKAQPLKKKELRKKIADVMKNNIKIHHPRGSSQGVISVLHKNKDDSVSELPIMEMRTRSRPIGAAPVFEINQTAFLATSLETYKGKPLGTNIETWPPEKKDKYNKGEIKRINKELDELAKEIGLSSSDELPKDDIEVKVLRDKLKKHEGGLTSKKESKKEETMKSFGEFLTEVLTLQQRNKRRMAFRRSRMKRKIGSEKARKRLAGKEKIETRSQKKARNTIIGRLFPALKDKPRSKWSLSDKKRAEKIVKDKQPIIKRFAKRMFKDVRKAEVERLAKYRKGKAEKK